MGGGVRVRQQGRRRGALGLPARGGTGAERGIRDLHRPAGRRLAGSAAGAIDAAPGRQQPVAQRPRCVHRLHRGRPAGSGSRAGRRDLDQRPGARPHHGPRRHGSRSPSTTTCRPSRPTRSTTASGSWCASSRSTVSGSPWHRSSCAPLPARTNRTENVQVRAETNGAVQVTAELFTRSGRPLGKPIPILVNATQAGTTGWIIAIVGRHRPGRHHGAADPPGRQGAQRRASGAAEPVVVSRPAADGRPRRPASPPPSRTAAGPAKDRDPLDV